jgi:hypothetical protein
MRIHACLFKLKHIDQCVSRVVKRNGRLFCDEKHFINSHFSFDVLVTHSGPVFLSVADRHRLINNKYGNRNLRCMSQQLVNEVERQG